MKKIKVNKGTDLSMRYGSEKGIENAIFKGMMISIV